MLAQRLHFERKLRRFVTGVEAGELELDRLSAGVRGWVEHVSHANTVGLRR